MFKLVDGCHVRATTRDNKVVRLQLKGANCAYTEVGPIQTVTGTRTIQNGPPGSKLADSPSDYFDADGVRYGVAGGAKPEPARAWATSVVVVRRAQGLSSSVGLASCRPGNRFAPRRSST